ncbi:MAG TPA: hypothetical protein PK566_18040 [Pseudobacteroides sp.]|nr:hypothetical protein [Pseudobacteroides sp.]
MKKTKDVNNFYPDIEEARTKGDGKRPPIICEEVREIAGDENGKKVEISGCKAYKIIIDGKVFGEAEFKKLFPNKYPAMNIKKTLKNKEVKGKIELEEVMYFYFPIQMLQEHSVQVTCRRKMLKITYSLSV